MDFLLRFAGRNSRTRHAPTCRRAVLIAAAASVTLFVPKIHERAHAFIQGFALFRHGSGLSSLWAALRKGGYPAYRNKAARETGCNMCTVVRASAGGKEEPAEAG